MKTNDGGPAYPRMKWISQEGNDYSVEGYEGMSLRDWFAGQALPALITRGDMGGLIQGAPDYCNRAYIYADAMLAERDKA